MIPVSHTEGGAALVERGDANDQVGDRGDVDHHGDKDEHPVLDQTLLLHLPPGSVSTGIGCRDFQDLLGPDQFHQGDGHPGDLSDVGEVLAAAEQLRSEEGAQARAVITIRRRLRRTR